MTFEVRDAVLLFSVDGFLKLFPNRSAVAFGAGVVRVDIGNDDREHLRSVSELRWGFGAALARTGQHDMCVAEVQLDAAKRLTIAVILGKAEDAREPVTGSSYVAVYKMRENRRSRNGAVIHGDSILRVCRQIQGDEGLTAWRIQNTVRGQ